MEGFSSIFEVRPQSEKRTKKPPPISPIARSHLTKVYLTTCCALLAMAFGSYIDTTLFKVGGRLTTLLSSGTGFWLKSTSPAASKTKRISLLMASAAFVGASLNSPDSNPGFVDIGFCIRWALGLWCFYVVALVDKTRMFVTPASFLKYGAKIYIMFCWKKASQKSVFLVLFAKLYLQSRDILENAPYGGDLDYVKYSSDIFSDFKLLIVLTSRLIWMWPIMVN